MQTICPGRFIFLLVLCLLLSLWPGSSVNAKSLYSTDHDWKFEKYSNIYMPMVDWRLLKSQCYAESAFDPAAVSPVGAQGICQFMPGTWEDVQRGTKIQGSPFDPDVNIQFAAYYMSRLRRTWSSPRPESDRHSLAMASYNAGLGHLLNAQRRCNGALLYDEIIVCLPYITGRHSKETITYVQRIWRFYWLLRFV